VRFVHRGEGKKGGGGRLCDVGRGEGNANDLGYGFHPSEGEGIPWPYPGGGEGKKGCGLLSYGSSLIVWRKTELWRKGDRRNCKGGGGVKLQSPQIKEGKGRTVVTTGYMPV